MASHLSILVTGTRQDFARSLLIDAIEEERAKHSHDSLSLFVGCASGADQYARAWWGERNVGYVQVGPDEYVSATPTDFDDGFRERLFVFRANWEREGRAAGPRRNERMVKAWAADGGAHVAIAAWSGETRGSGTLHCMSEIVKAGHDVRVVSVSGRRANEAR